MTYRECVLKTYWRQCIALFSAIAGVALLMMAAESVPEPFRKGAVLTSAIFVIAIAFNFQHIHKWMYKYQDVLKRRDSTQDFSQEDFIWNHPWRTALKYLAYNLFVAIPTAIGLFAIWSIGLAVLALLPIVAAFVLLDPLFGGIPKNDWVLAIYFLPFTFLSTCVLTLFAQIHNFLDARMKSNPMVI